MKNISIKMFTLAALMLFCALSPREILAQQAATGANAPADVDKIIRAFTAKETEFRQALNMYAFKRDAVIQTIGMGGQITGEYHRVSTFTFDDKGERYEKISFFPMPTLTEISISTEDLEDLGGIQPFALEVAKLDQYKFTYVGKERIDELDLYVFDVGPKVMPDPKKTKDRFFQGRVWVDDHDLQIVKARGKGIPEDKNSKYPTFETYREQIDGRYWFPTYTYADEDLVFKSGEVSHIRVRVRYTDYARARSTVTITEVDPDKPEPKPVPTPTPTPAPSPKKP
ncbi:MAG: hypothetical protein QOD00_2091 [Blastocatellia bacterium]|jgi:hypothetical protein|nr:hypothetical protein [Blastocatellia bacterium]